MSKNLYIISGCNGAGKTNGSKEINLNNGMLTLSPLYALLPEKQQ